VRDAIAVAAGRAVQALARLRGGKGSGAPGVVTNRVSPSLLPRVLGSFPEGLIVVSGTAGKSTTTKMLAALLRAHGIRVFTNSSTANLPQGITSAILDEGDSRGRIDADMAVIEMDEAHGARLASQFTARAVVLTNVMLDDLERFENMDRVAEMLGEIAARATELVVVNDDDASLHPIAAATADRGLAVGRYGVSDAVLAAQPHGLGYARVASQRLAPADGCLVAAVDATSAEIVLDRHPIGITLPARGTHFAVDAAAALEAARLILGDRFAPATAVAAMNAVEPVFGRGETVTIRGQQIDFVLVQNTASFQLNLDVVGGEHELLFLAIGEEEHDPSWLWTVHPAALRRVDIAAGPKAQDLAVRLLHADVEVDVIERDLHTAFERFLALPAPASGRKTAMFTASQMRELRRVHGLVKAELEGSH
jgi:UDP-N-acetylmuramyl tripeptide synthase